MTRAPQIEDCNLSRPAHRLRSHAYAPIHLTTAQQTPDSEVQNTNRPKTRETPAHVAPKSAKPLVRKSKAKARVTLKSP